MDVIPFQKADRRFPNFLPTIFLCSFLACCFQTSLNAQNNEPEKAVDSTSQFVISAQIRPRAEYRHGAFQPLKEGESPAALITQRTRLKFAYNYAKKLDIGLTAQSVSVWGQDPLSQGTAPVNGVAFFEAWAGLNLSPSVAVRFGRQEIYLVDERIYGRSNWTQGGRAHDALSILINRPKFNLSAYAAYNQNYRALYNNNLSNPSGSLYSPVGAVNYKWLQLIHFETAGSEYGKLSFLADNVGFQNAANALDSAKNTFVQTIGFNYLIKPGRWKFNSSFYYQMSDNLNGSQLQAFLLSLAVNNSITEKWNIGLGADVLSGNDLGSPNIKDHRFTPYFGTGHSYYGNMDYFYAGNGHRGVGLGDGYLKLNYNPNKEWSIRLDLHHYISLNRIEAVAGEIGRSLGQEADLSLSYSINRFAELTGGYSCYLPTKTLYYLKYVTGELTPQHWLWLSVNITPELFRYGGK